MNYITGTAAVIAIIVFYKLFWERRRSSEDDSDNSTPQQSDSTRISSGTADSGNSNTVSLPAGEYEVFLSFRGPDTRNHITDILYRFLAHLKIRTFRDDDELRKGEGIGPNLVRAIGQSKIYVPIISEHYAHSKWCLNELVEIVKHHKQDRGRIILPIFYMVDPRDVRHQTGYQSAFRQHKKKMFGEKTIQDWKDTLNEVGSLKGWHIKNKEEDMGREIVREECIEHPWMRSRIWSDEEAVELLLDNKGTKQVKAIRVNSSDSIISELEGGCFTNLSELRYFHAKATQYEATKLNGDFSNLLPNLKWIQVEGSHRSPVFNAKNLTIFDVPSVGNDMESCSKFKETNKLKVLKLSNCEEITRLPDFPKSGSLEMLNIKKFKQKGEDVEIGKLWNLKVLKLWGCDLRKIKGGTIGTTMQGLRKLNLDYIDCDYDNLRQVLSDVEKLPSLKILSMKNDFLVDVLNGIKLPPSLKLLNSSSGFENLVELLDLEEFAVCGFRKI